jgi:hypothetical protein
MVVIVFSFVSCDGRSNAVYLDNVELEPMKTGAKLHDLETYDFNIIEPESMTPGVELHDLEAYDFINIIDSGDNFRVIQLSESVMDLRFEILDNFGEIVWYWESWRGGFDFFGDNLLLYSTGAGTYAWWQIYFCPRENILSDEFSNPFFLKDRLIALFDFNENSERTVVIRDIFDTEIFYMEFPVSDYVDDLRFTASGIITYLGNDIIEVSHLFFGDDYSEAIFSFSIAPPHELASVYTIEQIQTAMQHQFGVFGLENAEVLSVQRVKRHNDYRWHEPAGEYVSVSYASRYRVFVQFSYNNEHATFAQYFYFDDDNGTPVLTFIMC